MNRTEHEQELRDLLTGRGADLLGAARRLAGPDRAEALLEGALVDVWRRRRSDDDGSAYRQTLQGIARRYVREAKAAGEPVDEARRRAGEMLLAMGWPVDQAADGAGLDPAVLAEAAGPGERYDGGWATPVHPDPGLADRVLTTGSRRGRSRIAVAALAAVALIGGGGWVVTRGLSDSAPTPNPTASATTIAPAPNQVTTGLLDPSDRSVVAARNVSQLMRSTAVGKPTTVVPRVEDRGSGVWIVTAGGSARLPAQEWAGGNDSGMVSDGDGWLLPTNGTSGMMLRRVRPDATSEVVVSMPGAVSIVVSEDRKVVVATAPDEASLPSGQPTTPDLNGGADIPMKLVAYRISDGRVIQQLRSQQGWWTEEPLGGSSFRIIGANGGEGPMRWTPGSSPVKAEDWQQVLILGKTGKAIVGDSTSSTMCLRLVSVSAVSRPRSGPCLKEDAGFLAASADGRTVLLLDMPSTFENRTPVMSLLDVASGRITPVPPPVKDVFASQPDVVAFEDPGHVLVRLYASTTGQGENTMSTGGGLWRWTLATGALERLPASPRLLMPFRANP